MARFKVCITSRITIDADCIKVADKGIKKVVMSRLPTVIRNMEVVTIDSIDRQRKGRECYIIRRKKLCDNCGWNYGKGENNER